jgi:hypothetical protein
MTELDRYGYPVERVRPDRLAPPPPLAQEELGQLLDLVVAYTRREPDKTMVQVWATQSVLGRWTYAEAAQAIHLWGRDRGPSDFLEPSDVTRLIKSARQDKAMREEAARIARNPGDPAAAERIEQIVAEVAQNLGWDDDRQPGQTALKVGCPHCGVPAGKRCVNNRGLPLKESPCHPSRYEAQAEQWKQGA